MKTPSAKARRAAVKIHGLFKRALATTEGTRGIEAPDAELLLVYADERWQYMAPNRCGFCPNVGRQSILDEIATVIDEEMELPF